MSDAGDYVRTYLQLQVWKDEMFTTNIPIRQYLQSGKGTQSANANAAYGKLMGALPKLAGSAANAAPEIFEVQGDKYSKTSLWRVFNGKGAPSEIQDALWLALLAGQVNEKTIATYADTNLGIDCGGFVANYWGIGRPSPTEPKPNYATGIKPRAVWGLNPKLRRTSASEIQVDDAAVFFEDVKGDDPNIAAQLKDGKYDSNTGSQAFHIGVVASVQAIAGTDLVDLDIAESSGARASSGGTGVNVRSLGQVKATVAKGLVWCPDGKNRIYFTGKDGDVSPYTPTFLFG